MIYVFNKYLCCQQMFLLNKYLRYLKTHILSKTTHVCYKHIQYTCSELIIVEPHLKSCWKHFPIVFIRLLK